MPGQRRRLLFARRARGRCFRWHLLLGFGFLRHVGIACCGVVNGSFLVLQGALTTPIEALQGRLKLLELVAVLQLDGLPVTTLLWSRLAFFQPPFC